MSMLHVHRSTKDKKNTTSEHVTENQMFDKNVVHCLYNLMQKMTFHKTLTPELVQEQLELLFDVNVITDQFEKLFDSVLGQCVQQVHVQTNANTLSVVTCKYVYGSRVAPNRVKPGTSIPTNGHYTLENKIRMNAKLQIQSKVKKQLIQSLSGIKEELLKAADITSVKNMSASKQNTLANYYEYLDYQNELKRQGMHVGLSFRFLEEMWDRAPPIYSLPGYNKDYTGQSLDGLLSYLIGTTSKYTFALNKHRSKAVESQILAEVANYYRTNTDNTLSPVNSEANIEILDDKNIPVSGVVILTDNLRVKLQSHILVRNAKLTNKIVVCEVKPDDFHPQNKFITDGKIKMQSTNLFVKDAKEEASSNTQTKKVEFLNMGSELFAIYIFDPAYYQTETTEKNRLKETVKVDFMMPLSMKFKGHTTDDLFKRDGSNPFVISTRVYFKNAKGVTRHIDVESMIPFVTGMLNDLDKFDVAIHSASQRQTKLFKLSHITKGREKDVVREQQVRMFNHYETFPFHYHLPIKKQTSSISVTTVDRALEDVYQKPLWIMISGLTYEAVVTNVLALWTEHGFTDTIFDLNRLGRLSLSFARRTNVAVRRNTDAARAVIIHAHKYVQRHNPRLYPWIADHGKQIKRLLNDKLHFPQSIDHYVEFVLYMVNNEQLYKQLFSSGNYHLGVSFTLNRTETFDTESMLIARSQGYKLFYSETSTEAQNDCKSPNFHLVTSRQTGHMPSSLGHPCIRYPHCILAEHGTMGSELISADFVFDKKKPMPNYDENIWIPIFGPCEMDEAMFEDTFNPYGRSNIPFDKDSMDYLNPDLVSDPLSGLPGYNPMCLGLFNMNFVFHSRLLVSPAGFTMRKHVVPNCYANFWFNEFKKNAMRNNNRVMMRNLHENEVKPSDQKQNFHYTDLSEVMGCSTYKFCYSHPKMAKTVMSERDNRTIPGRNVYRQQNDFLLPGSKLMENLDRGINMNDRYLL